MVKMIEIIYILLSSFFKLTDKIRDILLNLKLEKIEKIKTILFCIFIISIFIFGCFKTVYILPIIVSIPFLLLDIVLKLPKMLKSVRGFFEMSGIVYMFLFILTGVIITSKLFITDENVMAITMIIFSLIIWIFISCCTETKVGVLCNSILATMNGIALSIWNFSKEYGIEEKWNELKTGIAYKKLDLTISSLFLFATIILAIAAMFCAMKKYWEEKKEEKR